MGYKSRGCFAMGICLLDCKYSNTIVCKDCFRKSNFEEAGDFDPNDRPPAEINFDVEERQFGRTHKKMRNT